MTTLSPSFAYIVVYVKDVAKSVAFYAKAFGYNVRRLDESHRYHIYQIATVNLSQSLLFILCQHWRRGGCGFLFFEELWKI